MNRNSEYYEITVKEPHHGDCYTFTIRWDMPIDEWVRLLRKMLFAVGFAYQTIVDGLGEE